MDASSPSPPVCGREQCQFHGQCVMMNGEPFCECLLGYRGAFCEDRVSQSIRVPLTLGVLGVLAGTILLAFACRFIWKRVKVLKRKSTLSKTQRIPLVDLAGKASSNPSQAV